MPASSRTIVRPPANSSQPLWQAFLVAMLFFLLSEAILCLPKKSSATDSPLPGRPSNA